MMNTKLRSTSHGERTTIAKKADMGLGGSFCAGRKVWWISGRGEKEASSGCTRGGGEAGILRSKRGRERGE